MSDLTRASIQAATFPATVAKVLNPYLVVINKGSLDGVKQGQRVQLYYTSGEEIVDPLTKESLGFLEIPKGTGKVTHVQERMAVVESDSQIRQGLGGVNAIFGLSTSGRVQNFAPFDDPKTGDKVKPI